MRKTPLIAGLVALLALGLGADPATAGGKGKGKNKGASTSHQIESTASRITGTLITAAEKALIGGYIQDARSSGSLPPGLANREALPPGLARQIERNGTLPKGLTKRGLPPELTGQLPPRPSSQEYRVIGADIVLVDIATHVILDVLKGVLR
jgi:hypothetical protein